MRYTYKIKKNFVISKTLEDSKISKHVCYERLMIVAIDRSIILHRIVQLNLIDNIAPQI